MRNSTKRKSLAPNNEKFLTDKKGKKTAVVLDLEEYRELLEDYEDLLAMLESKHEKAIPWDQAKQDLRANGYL